MAAMSFPRLSEVIRKTFSAKGFTVEGGIVNGTVCMTILRKSPYCPRINIDISYNLYSIGATLFRKVPSLFGKGAQERTIRETYSRVFGNCAGDYDLDMFDDMITVTTNLIDDLELIRDDYLGEDNALAINFVATLADFAVKFYQALGSIAKAEHYSY